MTTNQRHEPRRHHMGDSPMRFSGWPPMPAVRQSSIGVLDVDTDVKDARDGLTTIGPVRGRGSVYQAAICQSSPRPRPRNKHHSGTQP